MGRINRGTLVRINYDYSGETWIATERRETMWVLTSSVSGKQCIVHRGQLFKVSKEVEVSD